MPIALPEIPEAEDTPLVRQLVEIICTQQNRIQLLEDEIVRLKGLKTRPVIAPSRLETPPRQPPAPGQKRPGSEKRSKTAQLTITDQVVPLDDKPPGATFKGYEDFVVQDLIIQPRVIRYRRERWLTSTGQTLIAPLPPEVIPGSHFGANLICFIIHQYHHQHVTQPLLWEQLDQLGIDISTGQLSRILTEGKDAFHHEKDQLLPAALAVSPYVQADDTGARHQGRNGYCTQIGNELFASFESTGSKSRLNFLEILRRPHTDYVINDTALEYMREHALAGPIIQKLAMHEQRQFANDKAWADHLERLGIANLQVTPEPANRFAGHRFDSRPDPVRVATESALWGAVNTHGSLCEAVVVSDDAVQFNIGQHALCWIHAERLVHKLETFTDPQRAAQQRVRALI